MRSLHASATFARRVFLIRGDAYAQGLACGAQGAWSMNAAYDGDPALLGCALENLGGAAVVLDRSRHVVHMTHAAERLLGGPALDALRGDDGDDPLALALGSRRGAIARVANDGAARLVRVRATPLQCGDAEVGWVIMLTEEPDSSEPVCFHGMWTRDASMKRLFRLAEKVAGSDVNVVIEGEMGTGKASLAAAIHALSPRHQRALSVVNCVNATPELIQRHVGEGGTLFFDNVSGLSPEAQAELLRVLERVVQPTERPLDARVIAATHVPLHGQVARGAFRADLLFCLAIVTLHIPPLRARRGDVPLIVEKLIDELNANGARRIERVAPNVFSRLEHHDWPGNVRELRAAIESAFAIGDGGVLIASDLPSDILDPAVSPASKAALDHDDTTRIRRALEASGGDRSRAAALLGLSRTTLWRRMRALGLLDSSS